MLVKKIPVIDFKRVSLYVLDVHVNGIWYLNVNFETGTLTGDPDFIRDHSYIKDAWGNSLYHTMGIIEHYIFRMCNIPKYSCVCRLNIMPGTKYDVNNNLVYYSLLFNEASYLSMLTAEKCVYERLEDAPCVVGIHANMTDMQRLLAYSLNAILFDMHFLMGVKTPLKPDVFVVENIDDLQEKILSNSQSHVKTCVME